MEDCCAVCAEPLEWVAYGPCGHRDVCSTCTVRLRVVLEDKRCCICKQEADSIFVTKALGDYTKVISDFGSLPGRTRNEANRRGEFWFDSYVGAFFDDEDEFKRIKAMCKLQCKLCEAAEDMPSGFVRKGFVFKSLQDLRRHLFGAHKLTMCRLCLEGRKIFIQDQKLYTRGQLERHSKGDSFVDGDEEERAGFSGHPMCNFCTKRFYDDNELYQHMSTEHFTCHLCKRLKPDQFEYYKNYDDLEAHFRNDHVLCEDPECLAKKFIVFVSESEFKIHNAKEHAGTLSRGERRAAMTIPVSRHEFRTGNPSNNRRGSFYRGSRDSRDRDLNVELFSAMRDSIETATIENVIRESAASRPPSATEDNFPALVQIQAPNEHERRPPSWTQAARPQTALTESAFPPLSGGNPPTTSPQRTPVRPMASLFSRGGGRVKVLNRGQSSSSAARVQPSPVQPASLEHYPELPTLPNGRGGSTAGPPAIRGPGYQSVLRQTPEHRPSTAPTPQQPVPPVLDLSTDYPELPNGRAAKGNRNATGSSTPLTMEEIKSANKSLVENVRSLLDGNEEKFDEFKEVHAEFKNGNINAKSYYDRVARLGLTAIIPELARLCPDPEKQQELQVILDKVILDKQSAGSSRNQKIPRQVDRGPSQEEVEVLSKDGYRSIRGLFPGATPSSNGVTVLFKADSRPSGTANTSGGGGQWNCETCTLTNPTSSIQCVACGRKNQHQQEAQQQQQQEDAKKKSKKKLPKYDRMRLGEEGAAALAAKQENEEDKAPKQEQGSTPVRGAWKNGGGQKLVATSSSSFAWNNNKDRSNN